MLDITEADFLEKVFDSSAKPASDEYEIVYAIIDNKDTPIDEKLPFFSLVNLMLTAQDLDRMHFRYSICPIKRQ